MQATLFTFNQLGSLVVALAGFLISSLRERERAASRMTGAQPSYVWKWFALMNDVLSRLSRVRAAAAAAVPSRAYSTNFCLRISRLSVAACARTIASTRDAYDAGLSAAPPRATVGAAAASSERL